MKAYAIRYPDGPYHYKIYGILQSASACLSRLAKYRIMTGAIIVELDTSDGTVVKEAKQGKVIQKYGNLTRYAKPTYTKLQLSISDYDQAKNIVKQVLNKDEDLGDI